VTVRPNELVVGNCYFNVGYADDRFAVPLIQTLLYVGPEEDPENGRQLWTFTEAAYRGPAANIEADGEEIRVVFPEEQLYTILDLARLMRTLGEAAPEHPLHPLPLDPGPASEADLGGLKVELARFFEATDLEAVTVTIRFTDDGFSLTRRPDGRIDLLLFPHPRLDPDEEGALRTLCLSAGLTPREDYLSDYGRTRILAYPVPSDGEPAILKLASRMFLEAYAMRQGDVLTYRFRPGSSSETV
jgi:hypothetical protein